jgi:hypothetical protein
MLALIFFNKSNRSGHTQLRQANKVGRLGQAKTAAAAAPVVTATILDHRYLREIDCSMDVSSE